jgi:hypothetical protein
MATKDLREKYCDNVWIRSIVQVIPYFGPLIDNALTIPLSVQEQANLDRFLKEMADEVKQISKFQSAILYATKHSEASLLPSILTDVKGEKDERKLKYYRNLLWSTEFFKTRDATKSLEVFPNHFREMVRTYSNAHFDLIAEFEECFEFCEADMIEGLSLGRFSEDLNVPGGCVMKILLDLERDCLIDLSYRNNTRRFGLHNVEWVVQTPIWDVFLSSVIQSPIGSDEDSTVPSSEKT